MVVRCQGHDPAALPQGRQTVRILQEESWDPQPFWEEVENVPTPALDPGVSSL